MSKAEEPGPVFRRTCSCGSTSFKASITLEILDVPVWFSTAGVLAYDDIKGYSCGWDMENQPEVACAACGHRFIVILIGNSAGAAYLSELPVATTPPGGPGSST